MTATATALLAVDVQRDFLPGGALGVEGGDAVVDPLLRAAVAVAVTVATRDLHPDGHASFAGRGGPWAPHCVAGTPGAEVDPRVLAVADLVVSKGRDPGRDAYSAFDGPALAAALRAQGVRRVLVGGLATDYCVRATALDALREGFEVVVLADAIRAVDVTEGDGDRALDELRAAGATVVSVEEALRAAAAEPA
ncbi:MAG TPA: isochorismatase family protein, partial [Candidatus Dormibacteraeota bacterium]|nr:isochorismatase family protein [Candidatus Dormibacteraeota bacterium]